MKLPHGFTRKKETIKTRLEIWDQLSDQVREAIKRGYKIPSLNVLIQPK